MGLDMYLTKGYYVKNWDHMTDDEKHQITILKGGKPSSIPVEKISSIVTEEIRWRKANAIHRWFVEKVQEGKDDCGDYYVSREQLQELLADVSKVLEIAQKPRHEVMARLSGKDIAPEAVEEASKILPTSEGFFFGSNSYDEYYLDDLQFTKDELTKVLAINDNGSFHYGSSW